MSDELRQDLYHNVMEFPGDGQIVSEFVVAQAKAIHNSRNHGACGSYGRSNFYECGVRWCRAARRIAGIENPLAEPRAVQSSAKPCVCRRCCSRETTADYIAQRMAESSQ